MIESGFRVQIGSVSFECHPGEKKSLHNNTDQQETWTPRGLPLTGTRVSLCVACVTIMKALSSVPVALRGTDA